MKILVDWSRDEPDLQARLFLPMLDKTYEIKE